MPPNWGSLIIVTQNGFIRAMITTFSALFKTTTGSKVFAVNSLEEAYALVERYERQHPVITNR